MHFFQNFEPNINFALLEYHCFHLAICLTAKKFKQWISNERKFSQWTKSLQEGWHFHYKNLLSTRGHDMSLSSTPGAVQSRFQQISQSSVNLGQSSQGFKKSLNCSVNLGQVSLTITWGIRMSNLKGYEQSKFPGNITKHPVLGAVMKPLRNLSEKKFKRPREDVTSPADRQQGLFPQQHQDSPAWVCLFDYYNSKDHNSSSPVDYSAISSKLLRNLDPTRYQFNFDFPVEQRTTETPKLFSQAEINILPAEENNNGGSPHWDSQPWMNQQNCPPSRVSLPSAPKRLGIPRRS